MTSPQWLGLALAVVIIIILELAAHEVARRNWNNQSGVLWREGIGHGLILLVATGYCYAFGLPLLPIGILWVVSIAVGLMLLLLDWAQILRYDPWPGIAKDREREP